MKKKLKIDSPLDAATCSPSSDAPDAPELEAVIDAANRKVNAAIGDEVDEAMSDAMQDLIKFGERMEIQRNAFRDALKQIQHNPGWQDPEVGFMSGHIAAGVLNQFPENE